MKPETIPSPAQPIWDKLPSGWPAREGSLARVCKPCIRPQCRTCASGKDHPNYLLTFTQQGRRRRR